MTTRETRVPALPSVNPDNLTEVVKAIKGNLDVREGRLGDPLDQFVTFRELQALRLVNESEETSMEGVGGTGVIPVSPSVGFGPDDYDETADLSTPPAPQGLVATGGYSGIYLSWYGNNYKNHAYTEVWRNDKDELGSAVLVGTTIGNLYADEVGTEKTYYYWVRFVSRANVTGPYNLTSGTQASTALDVVKRLEVLREDILNDPFVQELGERLTITETGIERLDSITDTQAQTIQQVSSVAGSNKAAVQVLSRSVDGLSGQFSVKIDNNGHVSGFGLSSRPINGTPRSAFIVRADRFAIVGPNDATDPLGTLDPTNVPFVVLTTPTTIGGLNYPAGAWIKTAFIADATITNAKIQSLAADKITAGTITAAVDMRSPTIRSGNISPGTAGFYLGQFGGINQFYVGNGSTGVNGRSLSFDGTDAIVRGNIFAYGGTIGGISISSSAIYSANYVAGSTGFSINTNGTAEFNSITARGITIYNTSGQVVMSSSGNISSSFITGLGALASQSTVSTGQVTGLGGLATQNSVFIGSTVKFANGTTLNTGDFVNTLSKIGTGNISTFIDGLAITNAYIGNAAIDSAKIANLAVDTIKIADNAVIVPSAYSFANGNSLVKSPGSNPNTFFPTAIWNNAVEVTVDFGTDTPSRVLVTASVNLLASTNGDTASYIRLIETVSGQTSLVNGVTHADSMNHVHSFAFVGASGIRTYRAEIAQLNLGGSFTIGNCTISVFGAKK